MKTATIKVNENTQQQHASAADCKHQDAHKPRSSVRARVWSQTQRERQCYLAHLSMWENIPVLPHNWH